MGLLNDDEAAAKRFEANQLFTPSAPIAVAEMFAGRQRQAAKIVDAIGERGRHVVLFGERGTGKSSIAQIIPFFIPRSPHTIRHVRVQAFPGDTFSFIAKRIFQKIHFDADYGEGKRTYNVAEFYPGDVTIDDFLSEMAVFKETDIPIVVLDEFNEIDDRATSIAMANILKALSDESANVTIIIVGVADNVVDLMGRHESIDRCTEQINMPRMSVDERREVIEKRISKLGMSIDNEAKWTIINLSKGLPAYVHGLGKFAVFKAIDEGRLLVSSSDVDAAINEVIFSLQHTLNQEYEDATRSNHTRAKFRHVLTACALAKCDEAGYFMPSSIKDPLASIVGKAVDIANFQETLRDFAEKRGQILERIGESRAYRFRFTRPAMQPYVLMRAIQAGLVDEIVKQSLSSSEQGELFAGG
jgi:Cdc6-like AAA superfamily ATPase